MSTAVKVVTFPNKLTEKKCRELMAAIQHEFDTMDWVKTYDRKMVSGLGWCYSMAFGLVIQPSQGVKISRFNDKFPRLYSLLQQLCPCFNFPCTTFTINKNLLCQPHKDKNNQGESIIFSLGNFTGGEFIVQDPRDDVVDAADNASGVSIDSVDGVNEFKQYDIFNRPMMFNGAKSTHLTAPFEGDRYSVVLYNLPMDKWKSDEEKKLVLSGSSDNRDNSESSNLLPTFPRNKETFASSPQSRTSTSTSTRRSNISPASVFFVPPMNLPILPSTPSFTEKFDSPKGRKRIPRQPQPIQPIQSIQSIQLEPHQLLPSYLSANSFNSQFLETEHPFPLSFPFPFPLPLPLSPRKTRASNKRDTILFPHLQ